MTQQAPSVLHARLRLATRQPHHALDHHPMMAALLHADVSVQDYGDVLAALHGPYAAAEAWLADGLRQHAGAFDYTERVKLPWLAADLQQLGRSPVPCALRLDLGHSLGALVGMLYTLEGATLGGQFIARKLRGHLPPDTPMRFYTGYGEQTAARWRAFLDFAGSRCPQAEHALAEQAACAMFQAIQQHLDAATAPMQPA